MYLSSTDREFLRHFALLVAFLHVIAGLLLVLAYFIYRGHPPPTAPDAAERARERIAPVGAAYAGETVARLRRQHRRNRPRQPPAPRPTAAAPTARRSSTTSATPAM